MKEKLKKLFAYYKPYRFLFYSDMLFAVLGAVITLIIPLIVRYITNEVVYFEAGDAVKMITELGIVMILLVFLEIFCNFYINYFIYKFIITIKNYYFIKFSSSSQHIFIIFTFSFN